MAGYRSVVATMWLIQDDDAPIIISEKFYKHLIEDGGGDSSRVSYALHDAMAHLREARGENNFARWVPLTHLGTCPPPRSDLDGPLWRAARRIWFAS
jgi:CHAT domain-containing protein